MKKHLFYIVALIFATGSLCAQGEIILSGENKTGGTYTACSSINLKNTFSFSAAATGKSLVLKVSPETCDPFAGKDIDLSTIKNQNYIRTKTFLNDDGSRYLDQIQYFDGLGRPVETVQRGITPSTKDLVTYQEYDPFGRAERNWLPSIATGNNGSFITLANVKKKVTDSYGDSIAYSKPIYEASSLNRVLEEYGPGIAWKIGKASIKTRYLTNVTTGDTKLICSLFTVEGAELATKVKRSGNYAANQLFVTEMKDEAGNLSYEFKDKLERVVLTRQLNINADNKEEKLDTYFVYDNLGNLCFVLPPLVSDVLTNLTGSWDNTNSTPVAQYAYIYRYDNRKRCIQKKLPGVEPIFSIYDKGDHMIFIQDGELRKEGKNKWLFSIPDALGREVLTGICQNVLDYTKKH